MFMMLWDLIRKMCACVVEFTNIIVMICVYTNVYIPEYFEVNNRNKYKVRTNTIESYRRDTTQVHFYRWFACARSVLSIGNWPNRKQHG